LEPEVLRGVEEVDAEEGIEAGGIEASSVDAVERVATLQPSGRKSQAVLVLGAGMPGVSGEENMSGPPTSWALAKEPGVVTLAVRPGLWAPRWGTWKREWVVMEVVIDRFPPPVQTGSGSTGASQRRPRMAAAPRALGESRGVVVREPCLRGVADYSSSDR
jgi:hypothetical protein